MPRPGSGNSLNGPYVHNKKIDSGDLQMTRHLLQIVWKVRVLGYYPLSSWVSLRWNGRGSLVSSPVKSARFLANLPLFMASQCPNCGLKTEMLINLTTGSINQIFYLEGTHHDDESKGLGARHLSWNSCSTNSLDAWPLKPLFNLDESQFLLSTWGIITQIPWDCFEGQMPWDCGEGLNVLTNVLLRILFFISSVSY